MTFNEYQKETERTQNTKLTVSETLANYAIGLGGEVGEILEPIKKHLFHEHELDKEKLIIEIGDLMWYMAGLANLLGYSLEEVAIKNIEKLRKRYPTQFSPELSKKRTD